LEGDRVVLVAQRLPGKRWRNLQSFPAQMVADMHKAAMKPVRVDFRMDKELGGTEGQP
jgi:hypothetical protein